MIYNKAYMETFHNFSCKLIFPKMKCLCYEGSEKIESVLYDSNIGGVSL